MSAARDPREPDETESVGTVGRPTDPGRERVDLPAALLFALASGATAWSAMLSWNGFTTRPEDFLLPLAWIVLAVGVVGAVLRARRAHGLLVAGLQVVLGLALASWHLTGTPVPGPALRDALARAVESSNTYASPVPADGTSIDALLLVGGLVAYLLVEALACNLRRVPLAGLPLLTVYSVPVGLLDGSLSWWVFAATAAGFLTMLYLQEQARIGRWGRALDQRRPATVQHPREAVRATATAIGVTATATALVVPLLVPTLDLAVFDIGDGPGGGGSEISIENPTADLERNLTRDEDVPLVSVRTNDPTPEYLRIAVLNRFSDNTWSSGDRAVPTENTADGELPPLQGVSDSVARSQFRYEVEVSEDFESRWLPTQAPISRIRAEGNWRYDDSTLDFIASEDDLTTAGMDYSMTAVELDYDAVVLDNAAESYNAVDGDLLELPRDLPALVPELAQQVTADAGTPYEEAAALQQWFRRDGGFRYSLESVPEQVGIDELEAFLRDDEDGRVGYCQQFAAAMAVMARTLGIPARVAVGFLQPDERADGSFVYSAYDLHAWPELYFPGSGWVRFDPTPAGRVASVPAYTRGLQPQGPQEQPAPSAQPSQTPSAQPTPAPPSAAPGVDPGETPDDASTADEGGGFPWLPVLAVLALLILVTVALRLPRALRERQRVRRLDAGPEGAWRELRASVVDLGHAWPADRSPRETRTALVRLLADPDDSEGARPARGPGQAPEAEAALARIVLALEQQRYSRAGGRDAARGDDADLRLREDVLSVRAALLAGVTSRVRRRAAWLPTSVLHRDTVRDHHMHRPATEPQEAVELAPSSR